MDDKNEKIYTEKVVAFIDILGFKSLIDNSINDYFKQIELHRILETFMEEQLSNQKSNESESYQQYYNKEVSVFSDSIVISYGIRNNGCLFHILMNIIFLQINLMCYGVLLRGGITIGDLHHKDNLVFGPAMVEAYKLESEFAKYPRIILTEETIEKGLKKTVSEHNTIEYEREAVYGLLSKDTDGYYYLDFLAQWQEFDEVYVYFEFLCNVRKVVEKQVDENKGKEAVLRKYKWFIKYFNYTKKILDSQIFKLDDIDFDKLVY